MRPSALALSAVLAAAAFAAPAAGAADSATAARTYELVSPSQKGGNDVMTVLRNTDDGSAIAFQSLGSLAGTPGNVLQSVYRSRRTATGWTTDASLTAVNPSPAPNINDAPFPADLADDLSTAYYAQPGWTSASALDENGAADVTSVHDSVSTWLTPALTLPDTEASDSLYAGRSADGRHVVIQSSKQLIPSVPGGVRRVYDDVDGILRLASVPPSSGTNPASQAATFGSAAIVSGSAVPGDARAISTDGSRIYFVMDGQLYVRIDGETTNLISASHVNGQPRGPVTGANAKFMGASDDGHTVVFTANVPLTTGATTGGLYSYDEDSDQLRLLAAVDTSAGRSVLGTVHTTSDGARTYFVSTAALGGAAVAGHPNLYVAGDVGLRFIAQLSPADASFVWQGGEFANQTALSRDGRRLAFPSVAALTGGPTSSFEKIYEYDLDDDALTCASCLPGGAAPTGDAALRDTLGLQLIQPLTFADDGTLFFQTPDALTPDDTDSAYDVYAYDGADRHLVSTGTDEDVYYAGNSADGRDVFVRTHATLAPDDDDGGYADIYVLRIGGGFPSTATPPCAGEACRGPQAPAPTPAAAPESLTVFDTSVAATAVPAKTTFTVASISAASRARWASTGKATLSVKVSEDAEVTVKGTATLSKKTSTVVSATGSRAGAGTVKLTLALSAKARSALKRSHKLTVRLAVTCTDSKVTKHATVVLRTKAARR
ncbi:MAG TPA: hypothetical protein VI318_17525 [Baekduia sp.]